MGGCHELSFSERVDVERGEEGPSRQKNLAVKGPKENERKWLPRGQRVRKHRVDLLFVFSTI